jgi:hypothetical protein
VAPQADLLRELNRLFSSFPLPFALRIVLEMPITCPMSKQKSFTHHLQNTKIDARNCTLPHHILKHLFMQDMLITTNCTNDEK